MDDIAEQTVRPPSGRINGGRLSRVGVTVANTVTAASVIVVSITIIVLAANMVDADVNGLSADSGPARAIGRSFDRGLVTIAGGVFAYGTAVLAASGLVGLLARTWRNRPLLPILHVVVALLVAVPVLLGAGLLQAIFVGFAYPFPLLALGVLLVWSSTLHPLSDASPEQLPYVQYRMRRRVDIAAAIAVGVQFVAPVLFLLLATFIGW